MFRYYPILADSTEPSWWETIIINALTAFWNWLQTTIDGIFNTVMNYLLAAVPADYQPQAAAFRQYTEIANCWVALDYGLTMLGVFYTFLAVFVVLKFILKLIPTVG